MEKTQSELVDFIINPDFLEMIKQPIDTFKIPNWFSFDIERNGRIFHITIYTSKDGPVNISHDNGYSAIPHTIIRDFCKTPEGFALLIERLDEMADRIPIRKK